MGLKVDGWQEEHRKALIAYFCSVQTQDPPVFSFLSGSQQQTLICCRVHERWPAQISCMCALYANAFAYESFAVGLFDLSSETGGQMDEGLDKESKYVKEERTRVSPGPEWDTTGR